MKKLIGVILCLSLALAPVRVGADDTEDGEMAAACVIAVVCIAVGTTILVGVYKLCKAIPAKPPGDLPPYYIGTNGNICTNFNIVHPRTLTMKMPSALSAPTMTLQASSGGAWQSAYRFDMSDNGSTVSVVVRDSAGLPVTTNSFAVTSDGTNRWSLCAFPALPMAEQPNQMFRLQSTQ